MESQTLGTAPMALTAKLLTLLRGQAASDESRLNLPDWLYRGLPAFVLAEGKACYPADLHASQRRLAHSIAAAHWRVHGPFAHGAPFLNAQRCLLLDGARRFTYAEGFVFDERAGYPKLHAWLSLGGKVVDFTGAPRREPARRSEPPQVLGVSSRRAYVGVKIRREYVEQRARETGDLGSVIDDWAHAFPLLRRSEAEWRER